MDRADVPNDCCSGYHGESLQTRTMRPEPELDAVRWEIDRAKAAGDMEYALGLQAFERKAIELMIGDHELGETFEGYPVPFIGPRIVVMFGEDHMMSGVRQVVEELRLSVAGLPVEHQVSSRPTYHPSEHHDMVTPGPKAA